MTEQKNDSTHIPGCPAIGEVGTENCTCLNAPPLDNLNEMNLQKRLWKELGFPPNLFKNPADTITKTWDLACWNSFKSFILKNRQNLVESILAEIPDGFQPSPAHAHIWANLKWLKQLIRDKYGK